MNTDGHEFSTPNRKSQTAGTAWAEGLQHDSLGQAKIVSAELNKIEQPRRKETKVFRRFLNRR
jgi:hypothetical protein